MDSDTDYDEEEDNEQQEPRRGSADEWPAPAVAVDEEDEDLTDIDETAAEAEGAVDEEVGPDGQTRQQVVDECVQAFRARDYIMEPGIVQTLGRYFQAGGAPEVVVDLLADNYHAIAQTANLLAEWLIMTGMTIAEVQTLVEQHLKHMIVKHFDPIKADSIFSNETTGTPAWLTEMIAHQPWRALVYKLAEDYPDCLMLTFTVKLISDAGFQGEITSISTASQQLEVFSRILKTAINGFLESGGDDTLDTSATEFTKMVCHGEHTFLYSQAMMNVLAQESKGGAAIKRLSQEISNYAQKHGHDATPILLALNGAAAHPRVSQALSAMLAKNALNPADITVLYKAYQAPDAPPVELLRVPQFLDLLLDSLFKPLCRLHPEHKPKYIYLLAYAAAVHESPSATAGAGKKAGARKAVVSKDELKGTHQAIEKVSAICTEKKGSSELLPELSALFQCIRYPVCALGMCHWVRSVVSERTYFQLSTEHTPLHLALLDEVTTCHTTLHPRVLDLYVTVFESTQEELEVLAQLEVKKMLLDRMVHLLSRGCVVPVVQYIKQCIDRGETDMSLIRYFVCEVLDVITPPFTADFVQLFYPVVNNADVTGSLRSDAEQQLVHEFLYGQTGGRVFTSSAVSTDTSDPIIESNLSSIELNNTATDPIVLVNEIQAMARQSPTPPQEIIDISALDSEDIATNKQTLCKELSFLRQLCKSNETHAMARPLPTPPQVNNDMVDNSDGEDTAATPIVNDQPLITGSGTVRDGPHVFRLSLAPTTSRHYDIVPKTVTNGCLLDREPTPGVRTGVGADAISQHETVEPNLVIDLNATECDEQQRADPIVSDNGHEERPTPVMDSPFAHKIIEIHDTTANETMADDGGQTPRAESTVGQSSHTRWSPAVTGGPSTALGNGDGGIACRLQSCGQQFRNRHNRLRHERAAHPWLLPYCPNCDRCFTSQGHLNKHVRTVHARRSFVCPYRGCGRAYASLHYLNTHKAVVHFSADGMIGHALLDMELTNTLNVADNQNYANNTHCMARPLPTPQMNNDMVDNSDGEDTAAQPIVNDQPLITGSGTVRVIMAADGPHVFRLSLAPTTSGHYDIVPKTVTNGCLQEREPTPGVRTGVGADAISRYKTIGAKTWVPSIADPLTSPISGQTCDRELTADDVDEDETIEPNLVIDLNPTECVEQQRVDPIVSDNVHEERPTPVMDIPFAQQIIEISDTTANETMADIRVGGQTPRAESTIGQLSQTRWSPTVTRATSTALGNDSGGIACRLQSCGQRFRSRHNMLQHERAAHPWLLAYGCRRPYCGLWFASQDKLNQHVRTVHARRPFACPYRGCGQAYASLDYLNTHLAVVHFTADRMIGHPLPIADPLTSPISGQTYDRELTADDVDEDETVETNLVIDLNATECVEQQRADPIVSDNGHEERPTPVMDSPFAQQIIKISDTTANETMADDGGQTPRAESTVGQSSHTRWSPAVTRATSTALGNGDGVIACRLWSCGQRFQSRYYMFEHVRAAHPSQLPYRCRRTNCDRWFTSQGHLNKHMRTVHSRRTFECPYRGCGREYASRHNLNTHIAISHFTPERMIGHPLPDMESRFPPIYQRN
ncbi:unnamed protein product [Medioppia subpectinata]|uniref:C2H2-type domain-containing protein n=1 Tax=Medioppia subpectinata TaxID=1979941 RepID=A0A7R9KNA0_9ACAR|nr:unnamed protein product [Medioppia subpectinata]CAG2106667.1 unnamed protein product [Medioppia subpectinata]